MGWTAAGLYRRMMYVQYSEQHEFELCMPFSQVNIVEMQSSRGEAFSFLVRHLPPKIWMPDTREYTCHPGYLQVTVPQTKSFQKHLTKTENKKGHWITSQTGWLGASASDHNPSNFSICYVPCNNTHCSSAGLKVNPFPVISCATSPELCNLLLCWGSCDSPTHIAASRPRDIDHCNWKKVLTSLQFHSSVPLIAMAPLTGSLPLQVFIGWSEQW